MADTNLALQIMNNTPDRTFVLVDYSGISQPAATVDPGETTYPPVSASSDFQVKGYVMYSDTMGGVVNIDFYMPVIGYNKFSISSNPEGRYKGDWIGSTSGWNVKTVARISMGSGDIPMPTDKG
jgi:hypothetical protein